MRRAVSAVAVALFASSVVAVQAQETIGPDVPMGPVRGALGGNLIVAVPVGEFADYIDTGFGIGFVGHLNLAGDGALRLRLDGGFVQYGNETREVCLTTCRIVVDLTTSNNIVFGSIGPELMVPRGFIRPYVNAGIGGAYFTTTSHFDGESDNQDFANTTNFDDGTFALTAGGGLYIPLSVSNTPISIDLGARYHRNGQVRFLREGDIEDLPGGDIVIHPQHSNADLVTLQLGVSVGLRARQ